jgi:hypothetical protein
MSIAELKAEANRVMQRGPAIGHPNLAAAITTSLFDRGERDGRKGLPATSAAAAYASGYRIGKATAELLAAAR